MNVPTNRNNNNSDELTTAPPSYASLVYKADENEFDYNSPPSYSDVNNPSSIVYINNYPGPPSTDGIVQVLTEPISAAEIRLAKSICIYLIIIGIITLLCGLATIGLQIGMLVRHLTQYYYYGFWGGIIIVSIGFNTLAFLRHRYTTTIYQIFRASIWQMLSVLIVFTIGMIILLTDKCHTTESESSSCHPLKIFNGFLFGIFAFQLVLSIIHLLIFSFLKREQT